MIYAPAFWQGQSLCYSGRFSSIMLFDGLFSLAALYPALNACLVISNSARSALSNTFVSRKSEKAFSKSIPLFTPDKKMRGRATHEKRNPDRCDTVAEPKKLQA